MIKFSERLRELRLAQKLKQREWAKIIGFAVSTVNEWETKNVEPSYITLIKIAEYFDVSVDYLLGYKEF